MLNTLTKAYEVLDKVFTDGAYASIELNKLKKEDDLKLLYRIVYGVLDKSIQFDYYIRQLVKDKPKKKIIIILKIGLYCLKHIDSVPAYAVVDNSVKLVKKIGKSEMSGFVNAVLKRAVDYNFSLPEDNTERLSVNYSKPIELVKNYIERYGKEKAEQILSVEPYELEHIRNNNRKITYNDLLSSLKEKEIEYTESKAGGVFVRNCEQIQSLYNIGLITYQSVTSMLAVKALGVKCDSKVLDLCAAPGGKSILISEQGDNIEVYSCDIHPHRIELINKYINRMEAKGIITMLNDATVFNEDFVDQFDYVLCDVPCSGYGLINKKPDIMLSYSEDDIDKLSELQYRILINGCKYLKNGGILVYSTCTTLKKENECIIEKFLIGNLDYKLIEMTNYLPDNSGTDGFFIARLTRI